MRRTLLAAAIGLALVLVSTTLNGAVSPQPGPAGDAAAPSGTTPALQLKLAPEDVQAIVGRYAMGLESAPGVPLEEIIVTSPGEALPMQDPARDVWPGLAAPVWALLHPTDAWRIFLPIPPD